MWQSFTFLIRIQKVMSVFLQRIKSFPEQAYGNCGKQKKRLRELGRKNYNGHQLIEAIQQMSRLEESAQQKL